VACVVVYQTLLLLLVNTVGGLVFLFLLTPEFFLQQVVFEKLEAVFTGKNAFGCLNKLARLFCLTFANLSDLTFYLWFFSRLFTFSHCF
jgi:hypothetical protein